MKIQFISYKNNFKFESRFNITYSTFEKPFAFDNYDVNIISFQDEDMWVTYDNTNKRLNCYNDLCSLKAMIENSNKSKFVILFPKNYLHRYFYDKYNHAYYSKYLIKDDINNLKGIIDQIIPNGKCRYYSLIYELSISKLIEKNFESEFSFINNDNAITYAVGSNKPTTIKFENIYLSTLTLTKNNQHFDEFIIGIGLYSHKEKIPDWVKDVKFYNDDEQNENIIKAQNEIDKLNQKIQSAKETLEKNLHFKSILYTNGDQLVKVVFDIIEELIDCDLSNFVDEKKEDFSIKKDDVTFIGEIKGITCNVKSEFVSQLEVHVQSYQDELDEDSTENVKGLLIINPFRNKSLDERDPVHSKQIDLAKRYGSLIITTDVLLKIYENYLLGNCDTNRIIDVFKNKTGLVELNDVLKTPTEDNSSYMI